MAQETSKL